MSQDSGNESTMWPPCLQLTGWQESTDSGVKGMFIQQISLLNILNMLHNLHFFFPPLQNAVYFIMLPCLVPVLYTL
jgi:hypothetical protein